MNGLVVGLRKMLRRSLEGRGYYIERSSGDYGPDLYAELASAEQLKARPFYNFGSGKWRHPQWQNVDFVSDYYNYPDDLIDVSWDMASGEPVPIASGEGVAVYCSHVVEHLLNEHVDHVLREAARVLRPGGVCRVTTPNIALYYAAYQRRDVFFNYHYGSPYRNGTGSMSLWLVHEFATQLTTSAGEGHSPPFTDARELDEILASGPMEAVFDRLCGMIDFKWQRQAVGHHVNWWTNEKLRAAMKRAGFSETIVSVAGGSVCPAMRDRRYFDTVIPTCSIFVEGIK